MSSFAVMITAMRWAIVLALLSVQPDAVAAPAAQVGALDTDCTKARQNPSSQAYQFVATCAGRAMSPDGRFAIVQRAYQDAQPPIEIQDARGRIVARMPALSDDMPFAVYWSPNSRWIAVNHHVGSFMDRLRLFEIVDRRVVERPALVRAARRIAKRRYPCLSPAAVLPNAVRWARDGNRLAIVTISSPYACSETAKPGDWWPLWMIGDVRTGRIDPASVRVDKADGPLLEPRDPLYAKL